MDLNDSAKPHLIEVAQSSLTTFDAIAGAAKADLDSEHRINVDSRNTFTEREAVQSVTRHNQARFETLNALTSQPAIARVKARKDDGSLITLFITRASPPSIKLADASIVSYGAPIGAIAEHHAGEDFEYSTRNGAVSLEIIEIAKLFPSRDGREWDSKNSIVEGESYKPVTIRSLRDFLADIATPDEFDVLEAMLAEDRKKGLVIDGIKRNVISKMGLRDQPILDRFQGEIFQLSLDKRLLLLGAPGTGKTTTLIRRLGQKLEIEHLDEHEKQLLAAVDQHAATHKQSWLMFTPTDLLKQYIKEAFNREQIPAPDDRIVTWTDYRRELARSRLGILQTATTEGRFVLKDAAEFLAADASANQIAWFDDFFAWQGDHYWNEASDSARELAAGGDSNFAAVAKQLETIYRSRDRTSDAATFIAIVDAATGIRTVIDKMKKVSDGQIRKALNTAVTRDRAFLDSFGAFLNTLADDPDEADEPDAEDEEEQRTTRVGREAAMNAYMRTVRSTCRSLAVGRTPSATSQAGRIVQWLDYRMPTRDECVGIGRNIRTQDALRRHLNPIRRYVNDIPLRYGQFRRDRQAEGRWYRSDAKFGRDIGPFELDAILLAMLRTTGSILRDRRAMAEIDSPTFAALRRIKDLYKNQIMVDEVADFSPLQLACMGALAEPRLNSFFACGDFNQRITEFGITSQADLTPFFPDIEIRTVEITYRHTRQLSEFAKAIVAATSRSGTVALPENVNSEGFKPVIGRNLAGAPATAEWLARRIFEIEKTSEALPSIAVLVNSEEAVQSLAEQLSKALEPPRRGLP
jgi:adenylate kinase family enzyme